MMRLFSGSVAAALLGMLVSACNTVDPDQCWPNTSGGFGGSGTIPIGAGVGATSGDFAEPPKGPLDYDEDAPNPCVTPSSPDEGAVPLDTWLNCKGLDAVQCMEKCAEAGAACAPRMKHPQKSEAGWGDLYKCKNGAPTHTCFYHYSNGDECLFFAPFGRLPWCVYVGRKP
jgi:hypothetical protein